ncbi:hypothetical protein C8R43DRAFT_1204010 [Mycena crocata]|nr:hypothetical protein C8R43DRAFT_1204010 [Mycena crocata]
MVFLLHHYSLLIIFHGLLAALAAPGIVSSSWRKSNVTVSSAERVRLASAALQQSAAVVATISEFRATVHYQMVEFDIATNQTTYLSQVQNYIPDAMQRMQKLNVIEVRPIRLYSATASVPDLKQNSLLGHAAIRAYTAYKSPMFLDLANQTWAYARSYTISADHIASGSLTGKNFGLAKTCLSATMLGGTFDTDNSTDPSVSGFASTYFLVLSALLAEATAASIYMNAALDSLDFITAHMSARNLIQIAISASEATACVLDGTTSSINTGAMIQGLAVLASITNNASTKALLENTIVATISNMEWQTDTGILTRGADKTGDKYVVRGLAVAYGMNTTISSDLHTDVHDYLSVQVRVSPTFLNTSFSGFLQFNAVIDLATSNSNNIYAGSWTGPPSAAFSQSNQTTAISALLAAISIDEIDSTEPASTVPAVPSASQPVAPTPHRGNSMLGAIVGATVGSVALLAIGLAVWFILRRRARAVRRTSSASTLSISTARPFTVVSESPTRTYSPSTYGPKSSVSPMSPSAMRQATTEEPSYTRERPCTHEQSHTSMSDFASSSVALDAAVGQHSGHSATSPVQIPTTELVRLLTERLNQRPPGHQWDEEDLPPPEYAPSQR